MILTMTTVGYGDIFPITFGGRVFTIIACIIGVFVVSLIIAKLTDLISLDSDQEAAYDEIMNESKRKEVDAVKDQQVTYFIKWRIAIIRKKPFTEIFKREMEYMRFKEQITYNKELIEHANPQLGDAIQLLSSKTLGFIKTSAKKMEPVKGEISEFISEIRGEQVKVDKKALELYDITLKSTSFLCMTNRMGKNQQLKKIDRLKMFFSSDGQKNKQIKSVIYLQEFMKCREPIIKFFQDFADFKKKYAQAKERKEKREQERKKREELKKERLAMIERGGKK